MYSGNILPEKADLLKNGSTLVERRDVATFVELGGQIEVALLDAVEIWLLQLQRLGIRSHLDQQKLEEGGLYKTQTACKMGRCWNSHAGFRFGTS